MKIRSVTHFCRLNWPLREKEIQAAGEFLKEAQAAYRAAGYEVQTTRLAVQPFPYLLGPAALGELPRLARELSALLSSEGIAYASLGPALPEFPRSYQVIPEAIASSENVFFSGKMADAHFGISMSAVRACARIVIECAPLDVNGFANLRFAALANVSAWTPFFPAAYHKGKKPAFSVATEAADLAVQAFSQSPSVEEGRRALVAEIERQSRTLEKVARDLLRAFKVHFAGIDFSLAPFPEEERSLGAAFERLGLPAVGRHGSLFAAAILAEAIEQARAPHIGFSGLMMPVLEDAILAQRLAQGVLTVKDLLLYSAVCGAGLDTVPLPGEVTLDQVYALLLDVAALAVRLNKPLTARLMPIPGHRVGDETAFHFDYFANGRVMALEAEALKLPLAGEEIVSLRPYSTRRRGGIFGRA